MDDETRTDKPDDAIAEVSRARERVKKALTGQQRGFRGPNNEQGMVELLAADLRTLCAVANEETEIVKALTRGSAVSPSEQRGKTGRKVTIQADDAFHLVENAE